MYLPMAAVVLSSSVDEIGCFVEWAVFAFPFVVIFGWVVACMFGKGDAYVALIPRWMKSEGGNGGPIEAPDPSETIRGSSNPPPPAPYEGGGGEFGGGGSSGKW